VLTGTDPTTYEWVRIEDARGGASHRAAITVSGITYIFHVRDWIYRFRGSGVQAIGRRIRNFIQDNVDLDTIEDVVVAGYEPIEEAVWFTFRRNGQTANDRVAVFSVSNEAWSIYEIRVTCMARVRRGSDDDDRMLFGDSDGYLSWAGQETSDGAPGGALSGDVLGTSTATVIDTTAVLDVTGDGLRFLNFTLLRADGTVQTVRILSNLASQLTLETALAPAPTTADTWLVGAIDLQWRSKNSPLGSKFYRKRVSMVRVAVQKAVSTELFRTQVFMDGNLKTLPPGGTQATRNIAGEIVREHGVDLVGQRFQLDMRHIANDAPMIVTGFHFPADIIEPSKGPSR
jgi:hypothetical protein